VYIVQECGFAFVMAKVKRKTFGIEFRKSKHKLYSSKDGITKENLPDPLLPMTTVSVIFA